MSTHDYLKKTRSRSTSVHHPECSGECISDADGLYGRIHELQWLLCTPLGVPLSKALNYHDIDKLVSPLQKCNQHTLKLLLDEQLRQNQIDNYNKNQSFVKRCFKMLKPDKKNLIPLLAHSDDPAYLVNGDQMIAAVRKILLPLYAERKRVNAL